MNRHSFSMSVCYIPLVRLFACNKNQPNTPSNHDDAPRPKQYTLIVRPAHNQLTPNLLHPPPNTQRHRPLCLYHQSIHHRLRNSHQHQRHQKAMSVHVPTYVRSCIFNVVCHMLMSPLFYSHHSTSLRTSDFKVIASPSKLSLLLH